MSYWSGVHRRVVPALALAGVLAALAWMSDWDWMSVVLGCGGTALAALLLPARPTPTAPPDARKEG